MLFTCYCVVDMLLTVSVTNRYRIGTDSTLRELQVLLHMLHQLQAAVVASLEQVVL